MKKETFQELLSSIEEGGAIARKQKSPSRSFSIEPVDVPAIRRRLKLTQESFALLLGISLATLRNWEQGRRKPQGPAKVLLAIAAKNPKAILEVVAG